MLRSIARGFSLLLGAFTLVNVLSELRNPGFNPNLWWIDLRFVNPFVQQTLLATTGAGLVTFALLPRWMPCRGWLLNVQLGLMMFVSGRNAWTFFSLARKGEILAGFPVPLSGAVLVVLSLILWASNHRTSFEANTTRRVDRCAFGLTLCCGAILFPLAQMFCFGMTDYRRQADLVVVFGCRVFADGRPSMALSDRVKTGVELFQAGLAPRLVLSGGPGDGEVHETDAMRQLALSLGVPDDAIETDRSGLSTRDTVKNLLAKNPGNRSPRVLAVSHFYHLPRIKLSFRRAGWEVWTVPAKESRHLLFIERYLLREIAALWWYYLNPD
jgi:vancomycin permeability regulator SanA